MVDEKYHVDLVQPDMRPSVTSVTEDEILPPRTSSLDMFMKSSGKSGSLIMLPSPVNMLFRMPELPVCIVQGVLDQIANPGESDNSLPNFPQQNMTLARRIDQNWHDKYRFTCSELVKSWNYMSSLRVGVNLVNNHGESRLRRDTLRRSMKLSRLKTTLSESLFNAPSTPSSVISDDESAEMGQGIEPLTFE